MTSQLTTFDKRFDERDREHFISLTAGLAGQPCVAWRKSYGRTGSIHFGKLIAEQNPLPKQVYRTRGPWVLDLQDCDRRLSLNPDEILDSRSDGDDAILDRMQELEGLTLKGLRLSGDLSLSLRFVEGAMLELIIDPALTAKDEQWAMKLPSGMWILVYGEMRWTSEAP